MRANLSAPIETARIVAFRPIYSASLKDRTVAPGVAVRDIDIDGVTVRLYRPESDVPLAAASVLPWRRLRDRIGAVGRDGRAAVAARRSGRLRCGIRRIRAGAGTSISGRNRGLLSRPDRPRGAGGGAWPSSAGDQCRRCIVGRQFRGGAGADGEGPRRAEAHPAIAGDRGRRPDEDLACLAIPAAAARHDARARSCHARSLHRQEGPGGTLRLAAFRARSRRAAAGLRHERGARPAPRRMRSVCRAV